VPIRRIGFRAPVTPKSRRSADRLARRGAIVTELVRAWESGDLDGLVTWSTVSSCPCRRCLSSTRAACG